MIDDPAQLDAIAAFLERDVEACAEAAAEPLPVAELAAVLQAIVDKTSPPSVQ